MKLPSPMPWPRVWWPDSPSRRRMRNRRAHAGYRGALAISPSWGHSGAASNAPSPQATDAHALAQCNEGLTATIPTGAGHVGGPDRGIETVAESLIHYRAGSPAAVTPELVAPEAIWVALAGRRGPLAGLPLIGSI